MKKTLTNKLNMAKRDELSNKRKISITTGSKGIKKTVSSLKKKNLGDFAKYLREKKLREYSVYYMDVIKTMNIPLMKLAIEKGLIKNMSDENSIKMTMDSQAKFLLSLEDNTAIANAKMSLKMWEEDKIPGIGKNDILPSDLVLIYAAQKKAIFSFLPEYAANAKESVAIVQEFEDFHTQVQNDASQMLFKIQRSTADQLRQAEEHFKLIVHGVKDYAIFMIDVAGYVRSWNKGAETINGYRADEIIGKPVSIFYLEKDRKDGIPEHNLKVALEKGSYEIEGWRMRKDRSIYWADVIYTSIYDNNGVHTGFSKITRDLTSRKKIEEEIKRSNDFLDSVLENIPNMVFVKDARELKFVRLNKAGEELLGFSRKDLLGKNNFDLFPKEQAEQFTVKDMEVLKGDKVVDVSEEQIDTKNGQRWLHTRKIPIKDSSGKPLYLVGISDDITDKREFDEHVKQLNRELTRSVNELELANKELESFSYSVSHDLRAPLRAIRGYTKILMEDYAASLEEDARKMMNSVAGNAERMSQLIDDLLAFSRMGKKEINFAKVDMNAIAKSSLQAVKFAHNNSLKAKITIKELLPALADNSLLENVFTNLISNAVKYSGKKENPEVEIYSYSNDGESIYCVKDNGVGFDMKYYDKLFGVFQRLHSTAEFDGTGVGLALVKRIITRHGGRVWAEAEPGKGAAFYVALQSIN
ncbi:MAG TPA: PAS domain S-box protein [Bacteroidia bacterium]|nr:PAS domain S-box protein [Bacteroidia bacterium]